MKKGGEMRSLVKSEAQGVGIMKCFKNFTVFHHSNRGEAPKFKGGVQ